MAKVWNQKEVLKNSDFDWEKKNYNWFLNIQRLISFFFFIDTR